MINREYTNFINRREYQVSFRVHACHMTREIKFLQPKEFYDEFIDNYTFDGREHLEEYMTMYIGRRPSVEFFRRTGEEKMRDIVTEGCNSIIIAAWMSEFYLHWYGVYHDDCVRGQEQIAAAILNENINYISGFSDAYQNIDSLLPIYHNLVYGIEDDMPVMRTIITPEQINICLKDLGHDLTVEDIELDIEEHSVLVRRGDHFEWACPGISKLLYRTDTALMHALSLEKLLGRNNYYV